MQEEILRTRLLLCGSHTTLNLMNAFCLSYCLRSSYLSQYTVLYPLKLYIWNCNTVPEHTRTLCNSFFEQVFKWSQVCLFFSFYPKFSHGHMLRSAALKLSVQAVSTDNLFYFWPTQGFVLYYNVKLLLSGIKCIIFSVLDIAASVICFVLNCNAFFPRIVLQVTEHFISYSLCLSVTVSLSSI